ncbi:MAG TPA: hypothetical protein ENJ54_01785 [Chloroflexi bacterium]|nr:hypothetical protein [Chloroflexota bacterium]
MKLNKIAAVLAFIIGGMAVFAGTKVVILHEPVDYYVISWLPVYNLTMGILTVVVTSVLLWQDRPIAPKLALATLAAHSTVYIILQTAYHQVVAGESLRAMTVRTVTWVVIVGILIVDQHFLRKA